MGEKRDRYRIKTAETLPLYIQVFRTKSGHFRARIVKGGFETYEVTIGGTEWHKGKGRKFEGSIKARCKNIIDDLVHEYKGAFLEDYQIPD